MTPRPTADPTTDSLEEVAKVAREVPGWLQGLGTWFLGVPLRILLILVFSAVALLVLRRLISGVTRRVAEGDPGERGVLRPLGRTEVGSALLRASPLATARRAQRARTIGSVLRSTASVVVGSLAAVLVLDALGVNLAPFIASAGIVGVAVGFGAQSLVKDFLSGLFMLLEDQYGVGDVVDVGPATGTVEAVGLRVTKVRDDDGTLWYVPNGSMVRVGNKTQGYSTAVVEVDVDYFADLDEVQALLRRAARDVAADPVVGPHLLGEATVTGAEKLAADAVGLRLTVRTAPARQWDVARHLRVAVRHALEEAGVPLAGQREALEAHLVRTGVLPPPTDDDAVAGDADADRTEEAPTEGPDAVGTATTTADPHDTPVHEVVDPSDRGDGTTPRA